jgi:hypothetical protein
MQPTQVEQDEEAKMKEANEGEKRRALPTKLRQGVESNNGTLRLLMPGLLDTSFEAHVRRIRSKWAAWCG